MDEKTNNTPKQTTLPNTAVDETKETKLPCDDTGTQHPQPEQPAPSFRRILAQQGIAWLIFTCIWRAVCYLYQGDCIYAWRNALLPTLGALLVNSITDLYLQRRKAVKDPV